jgi:hypothetical protein
MHQLAQLVGLAGEELAAFRRRALQAEAKLRQYESSTRTGDLFAEQRVVQLELENADLKARLTVATEQMRAILAQVRFLRQQAERPVSGSVPAVANGSPAGARREGSGAKRDAGRQSRGSR